MQIVKINEINEIEENSAIIIYGAGVTGKVCLEALDEMSRFVDCFIDDDINKVGKNIYGKTVISLDEFEMEYVNRKCALVIGSIYTKIIIDKLCNRSFYQSANCTIFDVKNIYNKKKNVNLKEFINIHDMQFVKENYEKLYEICSDDESKRIIDVMKRVYFDKYVGLDVYEEICSCEPQYFTEKIVSTLRKRKNNILDGGAFQGELLSDLLHYKIPIEELVLFEADTENYKKILDNLKESTLKSLCVAVNQGLWNENGYLYLDGIGDTCKISEKETDRRISVISIDEYYQNKRVDFIKMDIEGAELSALKGAENTIKRDRPILAICIYHSPEDFVGIPIYLDNLLENYTFSILHHTNEYVESILYAIPNERNNF